MRMTERRRIVKQLELSKVKLLGAKKAPIEELQAAAVWCDAHAEKRKLDLHELHPDMIEYGHVYTGEYVLVSSFTINRIRSHIDRAKKGAGAVISKELSALSIFPMCEAWYWLDRYRSPDRWIVVTISCVAVDRTQLRWLKVMFTLDGRFNAYVSFDNGIRPLSETAKVDAMLELLFPVEDYSEKSKLESDRWIRDPGLAGVFYWRSHKKE